MTLTTRQISRLNKLSERELVVFDGGDGIRTLREICFAKRGESAYVEEDSWIVYSHETEGWYFLEDCKFFILSPYPK